MVNFSLLSFSNLKSIAWTYLILQLFVIGGGAVSAAVHAASVPDIKNSVDLAGLPSQPYILRSGETPASVAKKLGLTDAELEAFNQFRTYRVPFSQLEEGDEIDIPSLSALATQPYAKEGVGQETDFTSEQSRLAAQAQRLGGILDSDQIGDAATGWARSVVSGAVNEQAEKWLSTFGTAQVNLRLDERGAFDNSAVDWLVPLYDTQENMLFVQTGARSQDDRNTLNLGWGVRWYAADWMYGFNNFWDNDLTGKNRRVGLGAELRTDHLQFAGNTYMRLTEWHQSRDFADYDERPANGFDLRVQGWLPAYPQVGGKLVYEQYYGDEVALFGKDERQRNPYAVTTGINWTPFPLLTLGVDQRLGKSGQNETSVNLQLTWQPDIAISSQLLGNRVDNTRLLERSRYNLVDRNNDIVLEYRKQTLITLKLNTDSITGPAGSSWPLSADVSSKYPLRAVTVDAPELTAAGGSVKKLDGTHFSVTLPSYKTSQLAKSAEAKDLQNIYTLRVTAEDQKGSLTEPQLVTATVLPPDIHIDGELVVEGDNAAANETSVVQVTANIKDGGNYAVTDQQVIFTMTNNDGIKSMQTVATDAQGRAVAEMVSAIAGTFAVLATAGSAIKSTEIHFVADAESAGVNNPGAGLDAVKNNAV
ncbi:TPA: inverse autotransporter beta domain-containing protein, partial [Enterobacter roggenkampii]